MSEIINCPFCGHIVKEDINSCPSCGSFFKEPILPFVKLQEFGWFFALYILTKGWFGLIWMLINIKSINKLSVLTKDNIKLNWLVAFLVLEVLGYLFANNGTLDISFTAITFILLYLVYAALAYRILRIIQKYTLHTYGVSIEINLYYVVLFNIFYLIHFIDTYTNRVLQTHEHFDMKWPYLIMLIAIFSIAPIVLLMFNPPLYEFWMFMKMLILKYKSF